MGPRARRRVAGGSRAHAGELRRGRAPLLRRHPRHGRVGVPACDARARSARRRGPGGRRAGAARQRGALGEGALRRRAGGPSARGVDARAPHARDLGRRRAPEGDHRLQRADRPGPLRAAGRGARVPALAAEVRWRRGRRRPRTDRPAGLGRHRVRLLAAGACRRHGDDRVPVVGGERPPPLHDPALRPSRGRWQAPHADRGRVGARQLQRAWDLQLRAGAPARAPPGGRPPGGRAALPPHGVQHRRAQPGRPRQEHRLPDGPGRPLVAGAGLRPDLRQRSRQPLAQQPSDDDRGPARRLHPRRPAAVADIAALPRGRHRRIFDEVAAAVATWPSVAAEAGVDPARADAIGGAHRLSLPSA